MRPKRKDEKKQEEEVDLSTLPPWNSILVSVEWHPYLAEFKTLFPSSQFFPLTREDIIAYSREKAVIPPDMSDYSIPTELMGRAFRDRLLNLDVQGRKAKKEMIQKYEQKEKKR